MKKKYSVYLIIILIIVFIFSFYNSNFLMDKIKFLEMKWFDYTLIFLYQLLLGMLLGMPVLLESLTSKTGKVKIDYEKILILGIPSLLLSTTLLYRIPGLFNVAYFLITRSNVFFFRILLGYTLITSFKKQDEI